MFPVSWSAIRWSQPTGAPSASPCVRAESGVWLVRVERVYDGGMILAFSTHFPGEPAGLMTERQFRDVIDEVNRLLADAGALEYAHHAASARAV